MEYPHRVILVVLLTLASALPICAQGFTARFDGPRVTNPGEAIPVGPFLFSPSLQMNWQHRDNIFFTPTDPVADDVYVARAAFVLELPIHESNVRLSYSPLYRDYKDYELQQNWSHFLDLSGAFEFSNGLVINALYRYVDGSQETREVDPGDELTFGDRPFKKNYFRLGVDYWFTARDGVRVEGYYDDVAYDDPQSGPSPGPDETGFYDYTQDYVGVGWVHQLNSVLVMDVLYGRLSFDPVNTFAWRASTSNQVTVGFKGQLSEVFSTELRAGWRDTEYGAFEGEQVVEDFSGLIVLGFINWDLGHGSTVRLGLRRVPYPSNFGFNSYYTASGANLGYFYDRGKLFFEARGRYQYNDYQLEDPATGEKRRDNIKDFGVVLGYRISNILSLYGSYLREDRGSNDHRFEYTTNIYSIGLKIGIGS